MHTSLPRSDTAILAGQSFQEFSVGRLTPSTPPPGSQRSGSPEPDVARQEDTAM